jgi:hypothetical protein
MVLRRSSRGGKLIVDGSQRFVSTTTVGGVRRKASQSSSTEKLRHAFANQHGKAFIQHYQFHSSRRWAASSFSNDILSIAQRRFSSALPNDQTDMALQRIHEILETQKPGDAEEFFFQLHDPESSVSTEPFVPRKEHITTILHSMNKMPHNGEDFLKRVHTLYETGGYEYCAPDKEHYEFVLKSWIDFNPPSAKRAQALLNYMQAIGIDYGVDSANLVLQTWSELKNAEGAHALLDKLLQEGRSTNSTSFYRVLEAWAKSKSPLAPQKAEALILEMRVRQIPPSALCLLRVMDCWGRSTKSIATKRCEKLFEEIELMYTRRTSPQEDRDPQIYQAAMLNLMRTYSKIGNAHKAEAALNHNIGRWRKDRAPPPTLQMYIAVLSAWSKSKAKSRAAKAEKLLLRMGKKRKLPKADTVCYTTVLHCWASSNKIDAAIKAENLLNKMKEAADVQPNLLSYTCVLHAWSRSVDNDAPLHANRVFQEMKDSGIAPDRLAYGAMITTWARSLREDAIDNAEEWYHKLQEDYKETTNEKCKPTVVQITALIQAWAAHVRMHPENSRKAVDRTDELLEELLASDDPMMKPNALTYAAILKTILHSRRVPDRCDRANAILRSMNNEGVEITNFIRNIARKCCPKLKQGEILDSDDESEDEIAYIEDPDEESR